VDPKRQTKDITPDNVREFLLTRYNEPNCHVWVMVIKRDAEVEFYDLYVPVIRPTHRHSHWARKKSLSGISRPSKALILVLMRQITAA
jgi:hypothetical protein